jgi:hypothetical protein
MWPTSFASMSRRGGAAFAADSGGEAEVVTVCPSEHSLRADPLPADTRIISAAWTFEFVRAICPQDLSRSA